MLRLILGISGVGLILLGMFGKGPLENIHNRFASQTDNAVAVELPAVANPVVIEETNSQASVEQAVVEQNSGEQAEAQEVVAEADTEKPAAVVEADAEGVTAVVEADDNTAPVTPVSTDASESMEKVATEDTPDDLIAIGDEVIATAADQAPASELKTVKEAVAATDEQKASDRNDQVELAQTILTSTGQTDAADDAVADKAEDVEKLLAAGSVDAETAVLVVVKDKVNLRQGPSIDHPVVLQLQQGQELMEFKREGRWVHVGAYGTSGKIGWVHQRLVGAAE